MRTWNLDGLRKHAKARGEATICHKEKKRRASSLIDDPPCVCGYRKSSHSEKHPWHKFYLSEGMCAEFRAGKERKPAL
jgi:hypothetical protein